MKHLVMAIAAAVLVGSVVAVNAAEQPGAKAAMEKPAGITQVVYVCPDCHVMALKEGKCEKCGKKMAPMHVMGTKDGNVMLCACEAGCKCSAKEMKDGKCGCGKDVATMSAKGMYVCPMGCPEVSDKPGKCACGKDMKKVE